MSTGLTLGSCQVTSGDLKPTCSSATKNWGLIAQYATMIQNNWVYCIVKYGVKIKIKEPIVQLD